MAESLSHIDTRRHVIVVFFDRRIFKWAIYYMGNKPVARVLLRYEYIFP